MIETIPDGKLGTWLISGTEFTVTESTELEEEDDISFAPGVCVEVEYYIMDSTNVAKEIESEDSYHCNGGSYNQEAYGLIEVYPASLIGTWMISGISYVTYQTTEFEQEHGSFGLGVCVKVKYSTQDGINHVSEIETEETSDCDGTGEGLPVINKVYALLGNFPPDPFIGKWTIGGVDYEATDATIFDQTNGDFDIGVCVEAKYVPADGVNTLLKVESEHDYKCKDGDVYFPPHYTDYGISYGAIEMLPDTPDLIGTWRIGGIDYIVDATTYLSEEFGAFTVGTYVQVKFHFEQGNRMAYKISSHVAPGAGKINLKGSLSSHENQDKLNDWVVDSNTYQADSAIEVGAGTLKPVVGNIVFLNAYEVNGVQYVTSIQSPYMTFMPMAIR